MGLRFKGIDYICLMSLLTSRVDAKITKTDQIHLFLGDFIERVLWKEYIHNVEKSIIDEVRNEILEKL